ISGKEESLKRFYATWDNKRENDTQKKNTAMITIRNGKGFNILRNDLAYFASAFLIKLST
ncbi:UNVERIFIED_CONTAM: hypothetical protein PVV62_26310, partial [Salmonella enterica subsp. enterica serovar Rissen]